MNYTAGRYVVSFQAVRFYKGVRYHWMICFERKPDELVAWGHALTQELAETAARVGHLYSGLTKGGQVASTTKALPAADLYARLWAVRESRRLVKQ